MTDKLKPGTIKYLLYVHTDFFISVILVILLYLISIFNKKSLLFDQATFVTIFVSIFVVNYTVFALSKYLLENYPRLRKRLQGDIDAIFKTPIKVSVIGLILSLVFIISNLDFLRYFTFLIYFLAFYSILSSYFAFKFIYDFSIKKGNS